MYGRKHSGLQGNLTDTKDCKEESISNATEFFDNNYGKDNTDTSSQHLEITSNNNNFTLEELNRILKKNTTAPGTDRITYKLIYQ